MRRSRKRRRRRPARIASATTTTTSSSSFASLETRARVGSFRLARDESEDAREVGTSTDGERRRLGEFSRRARARRRVRR